MRSKQLPLQQYNTDKMANGYLDLYDPRLQHLVDRQVKVLEIGVHKGGSLLLWRDYFPKGTIVGVDLKLPVGLAGEDRIRVFEGSQDDTTFLSEVAHKTAPEGFDLIIDDASHIGTLTKVCFWHLFDNHLKPSGLYVIEDWGTGYWDDWPDGKTCWPTQPSGHRRVTFLQWLKRVFKRLPSAMRALTEDVRFLRRLRRAFQRRLLHTETSFPSHSYGMVGFVKELVDEQGAQNLTRQRLTGTPSRTSKFERMEITPSIVFITKGKTRIDARAAA